MKPQLLTVTIAVVALCTGAHAGLEAGRRLQLNFTDGWIPDDAVPGGNPADFGHWNYYVSENSGYNTTTGNGTSMVDHLGNTVAGVYLTASGWGGVNWNGGVAWPSEYTNNTDWIWWNQYVNFWWAFDGPGETLTLHGLSTNLQYNVRLYALNPRDPATGSRTEITLNGILLDGGLQGDRWHSPAATTPFRWINASAAAAGELVFSWNSTAPDNPVLNALVVEAITNFPPPSEVVSMNMLSGTNAFSFIWPTTNEATYTLKNKTNLFDSGWSTGAVVQGTGKIASVTTLVEQASSFYRIDAEWRSENVTVESGPFTKIFDQSIGEPEPWYINDHCFIQGTNGTWHLFGITHAEPADPLDEDNFAHATATSLFQQPWDKQPFALSVATQPPWNETHLWAPHVIEHEGTYYMYYCAGGSDDTQYKIHMATSTDLWNWTRHPENPMVVDGLTARDPCIIRHDGEWIMYYTANRPVEKGNHVVMAVTSSDLVHWGNKHVVFAHLAVGTHGGPTESPFVVERNGRFYLFICSNMPYNHTAVYSSGSPFGWDIDNKVGDLPAHAAEVIRLPSGEWYVSRCGWGEGGVYLAELYWHD